MRRIFYFIRQEKNESTDLNGETDKNKSDEKTQDEKKENDKENSDRTERKISHDLLKYKKESETLKDENDQLRKKIDEINEQSLLEKSNYKQLYENEKNKNVDLTDKITKTRESFFGSLKNNEIQKQALKLNIREEALQDLRMVDSSSVITETTSEGNVNILGAKEFVEKLKADRPYWFKDTSNVIINDGNPEFTGTKQMTASDLLALQKKNPAKYIEEIKKRSRIRIN